MNTYVILGVIASLLITLPDYSSSHALYTDVTDASTGTEWTPNPICPFPSNEKTFVPYEGDCTKYWQCFEGNAVLYQCEADLWWHQDILTCDYPGDYCDGRTGTEGTDTTQTATPTHEPTTEGPTTPYVDPRCPTNGDTDYFSHPTYCNMYIECYQGGSYEMTCPDKLYFSDNAKSCVDAVDSECCQESDSC